MSKNVAVFVDVANIFYAAKAAGVDIDYVTLLKSAIAGRDFVRAYAYTGLDPENENQRQFHSFLARSGYKVVSKDIRKYGDGKIKANLDIELVVDMMKTARNLDVAVVVSGDGDFAPAIRAVQETGVRVEVISFRGNTSSDLMEVADVFTDIAQIARVEKGGRSGRRVAAADDLSMTEVPDKETEGASRRRGRGRGRTFERPAASRPAEVQVDIEGPAAAATTSMPGNLIVLPGERLSRAAATPGEGNGLESVEPEAAPAGEMEDAAETRNDDAGSAEGQRRRRRGGRGRGRGRGPERERETRPIAAASDEEEDEVLDEAPPRIPQYSTFGSVWDSQLGVATPPPVPAPPATAEEEEFEDEPEIPEYLLAERRQRGRTGGSGRGGPAGPRVGAPRGRGGRASAYQAFVERERYGGRSPSLSTPSYSTPRRDDRPRDDRPRDDRPRDDRGRRGGFDRNRQRPDRVPAGGSSSGEGWSEVPPELEAMLRAELAQKSARGVASPDEPALDAGAALEALPVAVDDDEAELVQVTETPATPRRRATRRRDASLTEDATPAGTDAMPEAAREAEAGTGAEAATGAEAPTPRRRTRRVAAIEVQPAEPPAMISAEETPEQTAEETAGIPAEEAPPRRRQPRSRKQSADSTEAGSPSAAALAPEAEPESAEPAPRRRAPRRTATPSAEG